MELYWYEKLMVTGDFDKSARKALKKINAGKVVSGIYLVMLSDRADAVLDICPSQYFAQKYYKSEKGYVIGAALSNELACELAARIVSSSYADGGDGDLGKLFSGQFIEKPDLDNILNV